MTNVCVSVNWVELVDISGCSRLQYLSDDTV